MSATQVQIARRDVIIAILVGALGVLLMVENVNDDTLDVSVLAVPGFFLVTVPVLWRRSRPLAAAAGAFAGLLVPIARSGTVIRCGVVFPEAFLLAFAAGSLLPRREALMALGLIVAMITVMMAADGQVDLTAWPFFAPLTAAVWGIGRVVRSRRHMADELQARTVELREARDERARLALATDRARLSAELDELLHRRLGELAQLADAGAAAGDATQATAVLQDIERESRQTLEEMRAIVGALRNDDEAASMEPQPTLTHLEALLTRAKGDNGHLSVQGSPRALPAGVELSAYRIVEHLLDAMDDAPDVDVRVSFHDDALELTVSGPARRRGEATAAIERARERVALHRGTLEASSHAGRAEAVAHLPVFAGA